MQRSEKEEDEGGDSSSLRVETLDSAESETPWLWRASELSSVFGEAARRKEEKTARGERRQWLVPSLRASAGGRGTARWRVPCALLLFAYTVHPT